MKKLRKSLVWMLLVSLLFSLPVFAEETEIAVYENYAHLSVNGTYINAPTYLDDKLYVPLRAVSEGFGYEITWNEDRSIDLSASKTQEPKLNAMEYQSPSVPNETSFTVYQNDLTIRVNGEVVETPHFLYEGTTYVPIEFFQNTLRCHVYSDQGLSIAKIFSPEYVSFGENEVFYYDGQMLTQRQYEDANILLGLSEYSPYVAEIEWNYLKLNSVLGEKIAGDANFEAFLEANQIDTLMQAYKIEDPEFLKELVVKPIFYQYEVNTENAMAYYIPTEADLQALWQNSVYANSHWMKAKHILVMENGDGTAKERAGEILAKLKENPADFDKLMAEYSEDPGSETYPDGYLFTEGDMVTEFYEGTLALEEGEISELVPSQYGYHIILKVADYENGVSYTEEKEVKEELHLQYAQNEFIKDCEVTVANTNVVFNPAYLEYLENLEK